MAKPTTKVRRRERKNIASGVAHVNATFNNTKITITDAQGIVTNISLVNPRFGAPLNPELFTIEMPSHDPSIQ